MASGSDAHIRELFSRLDGLLYELKEAFFRLEEQALRDELTGLYNRRALDRRLEEEAHRAKRHGRPFSLLFIDVDDFKGLNDAHGHCVGDEVLKSIAGTIVAQGRAMDLFFRYGGEEFVALLPETRLDDAMIVAERIRRAVAESTSAGGVRQVTVSVGVAAFPDHGEDIPTLLRAADRAQYSAKGSGKNRVYKVGAAPEEEGLPRDGGREERPLWLPPPGEVRVAVGFNQGRQEPSALWLNGEVHPITSATALGTAGAGGGPRYVVTAGGGRFELFRRQGQWFLKQL